MVDMQHENRLQRIGGRYELQAELGEGGMGVVYRSEHPALGRPVAIKVMHEIDEDEDPRARLRFLREARCMARVHHRSVARLYDLVDDPEAGLAMVLELIEGRTLHDELADCGALSPERASEIACELLDALEAAHSVGIIHRDLKPENVMLLDRPTAAGAQLKLIDFGLAKPDGEDDTQLTLVGHVLGTPQYMAPEQVRSETLDGRADIYALGVLLYQLLDGRRPFRHSNPMLLMIAQLQQTPDPLSAEIPAALRAVVAKAMAKDVDARFQTAGEMRAALEAALRPTVPASRRAATRCSDRPAMSLVPRAHVAALAEHAAALN